MRLTAVTVTRSGAKTVGCQFKLGALLFGERWGIGGVVQVAFEVVRPFFHLFSAKRWRFTSLADALEGALMRLGSGLPS